MLKCRPVSFSSSNQGFSLRISVSPVRGLSSGLMGRNCRVNEHWDVLIKNCVHCRVECERPYVMERCTSYCESAHCDAQPGHYYDNLLRKCVSCIEICGGHPAQCSQYCQTTTPSVTTHVPYWRASSTLKDPSILLFSLVAVSIVLLLFSLSLALVVLLSGARAKTSNPGPKKANHRQDCVVQVGQEVGRPDCQPGQSAKAFVPNSSHPADREPSEDSSPTETCVCVHCFPDLKALGQSNDRPLKASLPFYPQAVLHKAQTQKGGTLWTEQSLCTSGREVQEEAAVG